MESLPDYSLEPRIKARLARPALAASPRWNEIRIDAPAEVRGPGLEGL